MLEQGIEGSRASTRLERTWRVAPWLPLLAGLALLIGVALGWLIFGRVPAEGSAEVTFARDMGAHHDQAVEMATIIRDRTADEQLRAFALDIMLTQQAQRGIMDGWLGAWGHSLVQGSPMGGQGEMMGMASQEAVNELKSLPVGAAEVQFLQLMIRHHHGGVAMAEAALREARHPEVVRMAEAIVQGQQGEIALMQDMLAERGAEPPPLEPLQEQHGAHP